MIVRIATEGQYQLPDDHTARLDDLDDAVVAAVESQDRERFEQRFAELLEFVRDGELLDDAHLAPSDLILPPPDLSLDEAAGDFSSEGLIPG
jgi:hypothetical protein